MRTQDSDYTCRGEVIIRSEDERVYVAGNVLFDPRDGCITVITS